MKRYLLIILMLISTNAFSALNKWVDAQGRVHYSDAPPPPNASAKILRTTNITVSNGTDDSTASSAPAAPKSIAEREIELKKTQQAKKEAAEKASKAQAEVEAKQAYCNALQQSLHTLQEDIRMVEVDANGNRSFLDDTQRQQRIEKAQQDINTNCK